MIILSIFFLITSILYSSVGFGGGSTYLALMLIWEIPFYIIPILALCCNIIVVSGNSINYVRSGNLNLNLLVPYLIGSIPFAFFGASISISKELFEIILFIILFIAGILLLIKNKSYRDDQIKINLVPKAVSIFIGSVIGFFFRNSWNWWWYIFKSNFILNESRISKTYCYCSITIYLNQLDIWRSWSTY
jgi:uncharacterized membrane protein YfcA